MGRENSIGIIGGGIAGLQLALFLQQEGIPATLYTDRTPEQIRESRLPGVVVRHAPTRARERQLGLDFWDDTARDVCGLQMCLGGPQPITFHGRFEAPGSAVDMRLYLSTLLETYARRGGEIILETLEESLLPALSERHALLVVASGRASLTALFPRLPEYSPFDRPQRQIFACLVEGLRRPEPERVTYNIAPGAGEIFDTALYSFFGKGAAVLLEGIPDGPMAEAMELLHTDTSRHSEQVLLDILRQFAPATYERIRPEFFRMLRPLDCLQGAITPTVRRGYTWIGNGRYALALGDVHVTNDPVGGQGANAASYAAFVVGEAIRDTCAFDEGFCQMVDARRWEYLHAFTNWNNALLQPPPPEFVGMMREASLNQAFADAFVNRFTDPIQAWRAMSGPSNGE